MRDETSMNRIPMEWLDFLRQQFPVGSQIKILEMMDPLCSVEPGSTGTLENIDGSGIFHIKQDNGRNLGLVLGEDRFSVLPPPLQTLKLYMPMSVGYFEDAYEYEVTMEPREALEYAPQIIAALQAEQNADSPKEAERGLMAYFYGPDSVDRKVQSYYFTAEVRDGQLWGVAVCRLREELTPEELLSLMDEVTGQASDGAGESFEQRGICVGNGLEIYAHLWQQEGWSIMTEQDRFDPHFSERLPEPRRGGMTLE